MNHALIEVDGVPCNAQLFAHAHTSTGHEPEHVGVAAADHAFVVFDGVEEFAELLGRYRLRAGFAGLLYAFDLTHRIALKGTVAHSQRHHAT